MKPCLFAGNQPLNDLSDEVRGEPVLLKGEPFYRIENYDRMRPFFVTVASDSDLWMFVSSSGALTAGRRNPDHAVFPYCTDDKIHDSAGVTGPRTALTVEAQGRTMLWTPFSDLYEGTYKVSRNLYKSFWGNKLVFEEINESLGLKFSYSWLHSARYGIVRKSRLDNLKNSSARVTILDGLQNILPSGIGSQFQLEKSTLLDAYKRNELIEKTCLGLFALSSVPIDRPEPAESLTATTVWSIGLGKPQIVLSSIDAEPFGRGKKPRARTDIRGERGAYFVHKSTILRQRAVLEWSMVLDVDKNHSEVAELIRQLKRPANLWRNVETDILKGTRALRQMVGAADGLQKTSLGMGMARHYSNVLFNIMRGGVFADQDGIDAEDLSNFVTKCNKQVGLENKRFFKSIRPGSNHATVLAAARRTGDVHLLRIVLQYLPLVFSRRHGDPSRPWNRFSIASRSANGRQNLDYEGNWRDIFQNWEALAHSFPSYAVSMVSKFLNASTPDGYNPYRVSRDGFDWEIADPHDPWSFIGYWGDHQIIYLTKLLESLVSHEPDVLRDLVGREAFSYANVPYRIREYKALLKDPRLTVDFDHQLHAKILTRVKEMGQDGKSVLDPDGNVKLANLAEKLLVPVLAKLTNFVPEAGIWLNTQRPEWNDANNALVGRGCSMVTLYYLRRHISVLEEVFRSGISEVELSPEVVGLFYKVHRILSRDLKLLQKPIGDTGRKAIMDRLGSAGSAFRTDIYQRGFSSKKIALQQKTLIDFLQCVMAWLDHSIKANKRSDGMFNAYNLVCFKRSSRVSVQHLYLMLEGQVAILSSGYLNGQDSLTLLRELRKSSLYRADQNSYLLYPDRDLPGFIQKNAIPGSDIRRSSLLRALLKTGHDALVQRDVQGVVHFNSAFRNAEDLKNALAELKSTEYAGLATKEKDLVLGIFEKVFQHDFFTGRSGTFFAYEGLGSIYWHMVSKLLLATQETYFRALDAHEPASVLTGLRSCYYDIRNGIGETKPADVYGAFPFDPYSHTPKHKGASQPGLTGQVKEDILCRWGELGINVRDGMLRLRPVLLRAEEFLPRPDSYSYFGLGGAERQLRLPPNSLAFTLCQVPFVYTRGNSNALVIEYSNGTQRRTEDLSLNKLDSRELFHRSGRIIRILATVRLSAC